MYDNFPVRSQQKSTFRRVYARKIIAGLGKGKNLNYVIKLQHIERKKHKKI